MRPIAPSHRRLPALAATAVILVLALPLCAGGSSGAPGLVIAPPPDPVVKPQIVHPKSLDADFDRIDDRLETRLASLQEPVRAQLVFSRQITQEQIDGFVGLGGQIEYVYQAVSYGWNGTIPPSAIKALPQRMGDSLVAVIGDSKIKPALDEATRTGRVRKVWQPWFGGHPFGFTGRHSITIGIIDTGIDDSHPDLAGRMVHWTDWTVDQEPDPRDVRQHGTHVAAIALGTGASAGASEMPGQIWTLFYTDSGDMENVPLADSPIHIPLEPDDWAVLHGTARWKGLGQTSLYGYSRANGDAGAYTELSDPDTGPQPLDELNGFNPDSGCQYRSGLEQNGNMANYLIRHYVTYRTVGDGFNSFRGVAPDCNWAGAKVFTNAAGGGGDWHYDSGTGAGQRGVVNASGFNNIGMLVRVWGTVTQVGAGYVYIDDGSDLRDGTSTGEDENVGVRVMCDPAGYVPGEFHCFTGASSCMMVGADPQRLVRSTE